LRKYGNPQGSGKASATGIPMVLLKAPVCRPAWLVEIESIAVNSPGGDFPPLT